MDGGVVLTSSAFAAPPGLNLVSASSSVSANACLISTILCLRAYGNSSFPTTRPHAPSFGVSSLPALPAPFRTHTLHLSSTSSFAIYSASPSSFFHATR
ncbi:hypothetical protein B0H13DRAFT_2676863 [Mycena leptocephala]|nr:hypothetical protein B0H13DRAFT_2676863 [Mycena leptocephala]